MRRRYLTEIRSLMIADGGNILSRHLARAVRKPVVVFQSPVLFWCRRAVQILLGIGLLTEWSPASSAASVTLAWSPSTSTNVAGYNIHYGVASGVYTNVSFVSGANSTNFTLTALAQGATYYFAATSVDSVGGESPFSNETSYSVPATVVDTSKPAVSIVSPSPRQRPHRGHFLVQGKSFDGVAVSQVFYSLNGGPWTTATTSDKWRNWSGPVDWQLGNNTLQAYAVDTSGNTSATVTITFDYESPLPPPVPAHGPAALGSQLRSLSADLPGQTDLPVGQASPVNPPASATLTAIAPPAPGQFALTVSGTSGGNYVLLASTDLVNWVAVTTNQAPFTFVDTRAAGYSQRFFRAVSQP